MGKRERTQIQNIHHALAAAVSSINLAKRLLTELEEKAGPSPRELPGEFGKFDGHFMVTEEGEKYQIPENYASKSRLVYGDRLKRIVEDGEETFKQVDRVKRREVEGILAKKDGNWHIVTSLGSYEVLVAAVNYWNGEVGDEAVALIPQEDERVSFAALKEVKKEERREKGKEKEEKEEEKKAKREETKPRKRGGKKKEKEKEEGKRKKEEEKEEKVEEVAPEEELR